MMQRHMLLTPDYKIARGNFALPQLLHELYNWPPFTTSLVLSVVLIIPLGILIIKKISLQNKTDIFFLTAISFSFCTLSIKLLWHQYQIFLIFLLLFMGQLLMNKALTQRVKVFLSLVILTSYSLLSLDTNDWTLRSLGDHGIAYLNIMGSLLLFIVGFLIYMSKETFIIKDKK